MTDYSRSGTRNTVQILGLCEDLHGSNIGAGDPFDDESEAYIRRVLNDRLRNWRWTTCPFDACVHSLIVAVLSEPDWRGCTWSYLYADDGMPVRRGP